MKDLNKKRKIDEAGSSNLVSKEEELRLLIEPLAKHVLVDLLSKLGSKDPTIAEEIETIAYAADFVHRRIFVRNLSLETTTKSLRNAFEQYGTIEHAEVVVDEGTKKSSGYGIILYKDAESAKNALILRTKYIDGSVTRSMLAGDEGGGGQSSVPPKAALPVPPGYTYPQTAAPPYTYPGTAEPYATPPYPNPYPQTAEPYAYATPPYPNPYPQTAEPYAYATPPYPNPYPQTAEPYATSHYNSVPPGPSTYQTHGYGQGPYPQQYYQNQWMYFY